jgi:hypothetical protein
MSDKDPEWYDNLSRKNRDRVDQAAHFVVFGFLPSCFLSAAPSFAFMWWREFVKQAPIERIDDTARDMKFTMIGACVGQVVNTAGWIALVVAL